MMSVVILRDVTESDLPVFFEQQLDAAANHMAAFTAKNPSDRIAFMGKWTKILHDEAILKKTVIFEERVAGHVMSFVAPWSGKLEVSYWFGKDFWGRGIATKSLEQFLGHQTIRPLYARAARDNIASIRVLEKCGFTNSGYDRGYASVRGEEIEEVVMKLETTSFR